MTSYRTMDVFFHKVAWWGGIVHPITVHQGGHMEVEEEALLEGDMKEEEEEEEEGMGDVRSKIMEAFWSETYLWTAGTFFSWSWLKLSLSSHAPIAWILYCLLFYFVFIAVCRPEELRVQFERFGVVRDVYLPKDYYTGWVSPTHILVYLL